MDILTCFALTCSIFRITFSEIPPVFSKPKVPRKLSRDSGWESVWEDHFPDHEEKLLKNFFLKSASEVELQTMVREVFIITEEASTRAFSCG